MEHPREPRRAQRTVIDWRRPLPAPAKLNLFLHVVGVRADGYHLLQSAFRLVDRCDWLSFAPREDGQIVLADPLPGVPPERDLTVRAAQLLRAEYGVDEGVTIGLEKYLPLGGGLGGGSSDAATTLLALNHLWRLGLPRERLIELGLRLGADVPFFVFGRSAFVEGIGEVLQPLPLPPAWYLVIEPGVSVPTASVFAAPELTRCTEIIRMADFSGAWAAGWLRNDLQPVVCARSPEVATAAEWLSRHGAARMTGSGACVFAAFPDQRSAADVLAQLPAGWRGWIAQGLDEHPLTGSTGSD